MHISGPGTEDDWESDMDDESFQERFQQGLADLDVLKTLLDTVAQSCKHLGHLAISVEALQLASEEGTPICPVAHDLQ